MTALTFDCTHYALALLRLTVNVFCVQFWQLHISSRTFFPLLGEKNSMFFIIQDQEAYSSMINFISSLARRCSTRWRSCAYSSKEMLVSMREKGWRSFTYDISSTVFLVLVFFIRVDRHPRGACNRNVHPTHWPHSWQTTACSKRSQRIQFDDLFSRQTWSAWR